MNIGFLLNQNYRMSNMMKAISSNIRRSSERLASGKQINSAADSPSSMFRISRLEAQVRGSQVAQSNIQDGISLVQTADSSMSALGNIGQKLKDLSSKYKNDTLSSDDKNSIEEQATALLNEMGNQLKDSKFNGISIFDKSSFNIQTGPNAGQSYTIKIDDLSNLKNIVNQAQNNFSNNTSSSTSTSTTTNQSSGSNSTANPSTSGAYNYTTGVSFNHSNPNYTGWDKLYDKKLNLIYEGTFSNGVPDGYGKVFNSNGAKTYDGNLKQGKFDGYGTLSDDKGNTIYSGSFSNGVFNGYGTLYNNGQEVYSGNFLNGQYSTTNESSTIGSSSSQANSTITGTDTDTSTKSTSNTSSRTNTQTNSDSNKKLSIKDILDTDFIDKNILNPINKMRTSLGIAENSLEIRYDSEQNEEIQSSDVLSRITDVDMAKELMNKTKNEILLSTNLSLFSDNLDKNRDYIDQLLR